MYLWCGGLKSKRKDKWRHIAKIIKNRTKKDKGSGGEIRSIEEVEKLALGKKRKIGNRAGCVHQRNKCMQDALRSLGASQWRVGVGRRKGWRRTKEAMELNAWRRRGIQQAKRARDRHAPSATIHVRKTEEGERKREREIEKGEKEG